MLSVAIITFNEEEKLRKTLESIHSLAEEIVVLDSFSTDATREIAKSFGARVECKEFTGFSDQKNHIIDLCKGDWILLIDADEEISGDLAVEVGKELENPRAKVYECRFVSHCFGKKILYGGWSNFYKIRLFKKGSVRFGTEKIHERFLFGQNVEVVRLHGVINHYTYNTIEECLAKMNFYSSASARDLLNKGSSASIIPLICSSMIIFLKRFFIKLGFLDGYYGFILAVFMAHLHFSKYAKLRLLKGQSRQQRDEVQLPKDR
jgi:glycosyltransferase involved in cell wall biosynthesis